MAAQELSTEISPKTEEYLNAGKELYRQDKLKEAIETWQKALEIDPANTQAQRYIERAKERLQETEQPKTTPLEKSKIETSQDEKNPEPLKATIEIKPFNAKGPELLPAKGKPIRMLNLKQATQTALDNSISLTTAKREIKLSKQKVKDAWRALFPAASVKWEEIGGTTTGEDFHGREFYLELQQPLYQGGRLTNTLKQSQINMQVARHNYQKIKNDLVFEVQQAYFILASTKKTYRELTELLALANSDYKLAEKEYELSLEREVDFLNVKNLFQETEYKVLSNQKDLTLAYLTLYQTLNIDPQNTTIDIPEAPDPKILEIDLDKCTQIALENRADLTIKQLLFKFNKYGLQIALSQNRLKIDLTASGGLKDEVFITEAIDLQPEWYVGIKGSIPLWLNTLEYSFIDQDKVPSAGQTTSTQFKSSTTTLRLFDSTAYTSITEAKVNLDKAKDELEKLEKSVTFETKQDFYEYQKAVYQLSNSATKLKLNEVELAIVETQRDLNLATTNDVLRTRVKLWEAKTGYHQATAGYFTSIAKLNKTIGLSEYFNPMEDETAEISYPIPPPDLSLALSQLNISPKTVDIKQELKNSQFSHMSNKTNTIEQTKKPIQDTKQLTPEKDKLSAKQELAKQKEEEKQKLAKEKEAKRIAEQKQKEEQKKIEQAKKEEANKQKEEVKKAEAAKKAEEKRLTEEKKLEDKKKQQEEKEKLNKEKEAKNPENQKDKEKDSQKQQEEKERLAKEKEERKLAEQKKQEEQKQAEQAKKEEQKKIEQAKKEEANKQKEEARKAEAAKKAEEKRLAEEKKLEDKQKQQEEKERLAKEKEERKLAEQKKQEEQKQAEQAKKEEQQKKTEQERKQKEEEKQKLAKEKEEKRIAEQKQKEEQKKIEQAKKEEANKQKEEVRKAEAAKKAEEKRLAEEKKLEDKQKQQEEKERLAKEKETKKPEQTENINAEIQKAKQEILTDLKKEKQEREKNKSQVEPKKSVQVNESTQPDEYARAEQLANEIAKKKTEKQALLKSGDQKKLNQFKKSEEQKKKLEDKKDIKQIEKEQKIEREKKLAESKEKAKEDKKLLKLKQEEDKKIAQIKKQEEKKVAQQKKEQDAKIREEEKQKLAKEKEERKLAEQKKKEEQKQLEQAKKEEQQKKEEQDRKQKEEDKQKLAKEKEEKRITEQKQKEEHKKEKTKQDSAQTKENAQPKQTEEAQPLAPTQQQQILTDSKPSEYQKAVDAAKEKLSQLENERNTLLNTLKSQKENQINETNKCLEQAKTYYSNKDYASAIKEWSKASALDPANQEARDGIKKAEDALRKK
jgi:outer membrane protein TolC